MRDETGSLAATSQTAEAEGQLHCAGPHHRALFTDPTIDRQWVAILLEAAGFVAAGLIVWQPGKLMTEWDERLPDNEAADPAKHAAYATHMAQVIEEKLPWLIHMLNAAGASMLVSPGVCAFSVPNRLGECFDIRELLPYSLLVPWVADDDKILMQ